MEHLISFTQEELQLIRMLTVLGTGDSDNSIRQISDSIFYKIAELTGSVNPLGYIRMVADSIMYKPDTLRAFKKETASAVNFVTSNSKPSLTITFDTVEEIKYLRSVFSADGGMRYIGYLSITSGTLLSVTSGTVLSEEYIGNFDNDLHSALTNMLNQKNGD